MKKITTVKTRSVMDLINEKKNPNYRGRSNKLPETGPLRVNKPLVYNTKNVPNPVIDKVEADKIKGIQSANQWVPEYKK
jgi:hypothetical protein